MFPLQNINRSYRKGFQRQISLGNTGLKKIGKVSLLWDCAELLFNWDASWISKVIFPWNTHTHTHMHTFPFFHSWENLIHAASEPLSISPSVVIVTEVPMPRFSIHCSLHCITLHPKTVSHYQQFRSYPSTHPPFLCFMDKYRRAEGGKNRNKRKERKNKRGKEEEKVKWEICISLEEGIRSKPTKWDLIFFDAFLHEQWAAADWSWWWFSQTTNVWVKWSKLLHPFDGHKTAIASIYKEAVDRASVYVTVKFFGTLGGVSLVVGSVFFKGSLSTISTLQKTSWTLKMPCHLAFMPFIWVNSHQKISDLPAVCWIVLLSTAYTWISLPIWFQVRVDWKWCRTILGS